MLSETYLTPDEVAERLNVSIPSVRAWLRAGKLRGGKAGSLWRVAEEDLESFSKKLEWDSMTREQRIQRIQSIQEKYADVNISTEKYLRHKREDVEREERARQER